MNFTGFVDHDTLHMLQRVVDKHCLRHGIVSAEARESVAASTFTHFRNGERSEWKLLRLLDREDRPKPAAAASVASNGRQPVARS